MSFKAEDDRVLGHRDDPPPQGAHAVGDSR